MAPAARGTGLASWMLRAAEPIARELGVTTLLAEIHPDNQPSIKAFKRAGFYSFVQPAGAESLLRCERRIVRFHT